MMPRVLRLGAFAVALAGAIVLLAWPAAAQTPDGVVVRIASVDDSQYPAVRAVFTADEDGRPIADLRPENVTITESGAPARSPKLESAAATTMPLALVVTFDTSGSMAGANLAQSKAAATALFQSLSPTDIGALITFADEVRVAVPLPGKAADLEAAVARLQAVGNTALYDAVAESGRVAAASGVARRAVVLFSDGEDSGGRSGITREQSLQEAQNGQALFYVIGVGQQVDRAYLEELARRSGGRYFQAASAAEVPAIYGTIAAYLRSQYVVTFESSAPAATQDRSLRIEVKTATGSGGSELTYRSQRQPPTPTAAPPTPAPTVPAATTEPQVEAGGSGGGALTWLIAGTVVLAAGGGGVVFWRRRRSRAAPKEDAPARPAPLPRASPLDAPTHRGTLAAIRGGQQEQSFPVDGRPVTIGAGTGCDIKLADPQIEGTELRLWWRDGSMMAHVLKDRGAAPLLNGLPFRWASLKDGDELQLGAYSVRYSQEPGKNGR